MEFSLRPISHSDLESLLKHANNPKIAANLTDRFVYPYTREIGEGFIQFARKMDPPNILAIVVKDELIGAIGIHPQEDISRFNAELGYWLSEDYWGQGIMTKAIAEMIEYAFENFEINRIFARPFDHNPASKNILEKNGFVFEARIEKNLFKNGVFIDEVIYGLRKK